MLVFRFICWLGGNVAVVVVKLLRFVAGEDYVTRLTQRVLAAVMQNAAMLAGNPEIRTLMVDGGNASDLLDVEEAVASSPFGKGTITDKEFTEGVLAGLAGAVIGRVECHENGTPGASYIVLHTSKGCVSVGAQCLEFSVFPGEEVPC